MYLAVATRPDNEHCVELVANGISNVIILKKETLEEDIKWAKSVHNRFHGGVGETLAEVFRSVPVALASWKLEKDRNQWSTKNMPFKRAFHLRKAVRRSHVEELQPHTVALGTLRQHEERVQLHAGHKYRGYIFETA